MIGGDDDDDDESADDDDDDDDEAVEMGVGAAESTPVANPAAGAVSVLLSGGGKNGEEAVELSQRMGEFECCEVREATTRAVELERPLQEKEAEMAAKDAEMAAKNKQSHRLSDAPLKAESSVCISYCCVSV
jgi:hypothetical protein